MSNNKDLVDEKKNIYEYMDVKRFNDPFRMLILGASMSGKTHFFLNTIYKAICSNFHKIILFTSISNKPEYVKIIPENKLVFIDVFSYENEAIINLINGIKEFIENTQKIGETQTGKVIYEYNYLFIFDDFYNDKIIKSPTFVSIFTNFRHLQVSTCFISQKLDVMVSNVMKENSTFILIFKLAGDSASKAVTLISSVIGAVVDRKELKRISEGIFMNRVLSNKWGYTIVDVEQTKLYLELKHIPKKKILKKKKK